METRASYLIVGIFVIAGFTGLVFAAMWITGTRADRSMAVYDIYFEGSVTGLAPGNSVQYRGIPVGSVIDMRIDPENVEKILVTIEIDATTPIKADTEATLAMQGITGLSFVQLAGGTQSAADLVAPPGRGRPIIASRPSQLAELFDAAPELLRRAIAVVEQMEEILSPENQQRIADTLENIENMTGAVAGGSDDIGRILSEGSEAIADLRKLTGALAENSDDISSILSDGAGTMKDFRTLTGALADNSGDIETLLASGADTMENVDKITGTLVESSDDIGKMLAEGAATMVELRQAAASAKTMLVSVEGDIGSISKDARAVLVDVRRAVGQLAVASEEFTKILTDNSDAIDNFASTGLYEFSQFLSEARVLVAALTRLTAQMERDPARFLFGDQQKGVEVQ